MILKFFRTSLSCIHNNPLIKRSVYAISDDPDKKKGFGNFERKKSPVDKNKNIKTQQQKKVQQPLNQLKKQKSNTKVQAQSQSNKTTDGQIRSKKQSEPYAQSTNQAFNKFKRISKVQLKKQEPINQNLSKNNDQNIENNSNQNENKSDHNVENEGQKMEQKFRRVKRNVKRPQNSNTLNTKQQKNQNTKESDEQTNKDEGAFAKKKQTSGSTNKIANNQQNQKSTRGSFDRFKRGKKLQNNTVQKTQEIHKEEKKIQNPFLNQRKQQNNQQGDKHDGLQRFRRSKNTKKPNQTEQKKQQNQPFSEEKQYNTQTSNLNKVQNEQMNSKKSDISEEEQRIKQQQAYQAAKQKIFKQKLQYYKQIKHQQQINGKRFEFYKQYKDLLIERIYKLTGINLGPNAQPPSWAKNNPIGLLLFQNRVLLILAFILYQLYNSYQSFIEQITPEQLISKIQKGEISQILFQQKEHETESEAGRKNRTSALIQTKNNEVFTCVSNKQFQSLIKTKVSIINFINTTQPPIIVTNQRKQVSSQVGLIRYVLSLAMAWLFFASIFGASKGASRGKGSALFQQSKSKRFQQKVNVKFNDVVGMQKAKQEIVQFIDFLMNPDKYHKLGAKIPKGALLTGPPGTGKTMIAKACAGESNVPFFTISGSQFIQMYVGVGAQRVRDIFKQAKQVAPSIIFIDEIDAVGKKRSAGFGGGNDQRDNTLNQLLVQMDGFETKSNVIVFAATNQKEVLDPALTRPGRFDRLIEVDLPDLQGRKQIFLVHLKPIVIDSESTMEAYAKRMATLTPGFSGADIKNLCNEAAIMAARNGNKFVTMQDFELATERVIAGVEKKSHLITPQTRRTVAYHECGHGVVSWFLEGANPLLKLTIIPRSKGSLGFAQYLPHQVQISTKRQLEDQICVILAGRVSEQIFFGRISTGAIDDLQKAYQIAKKIVTTYGMNQRLGWLSYEQTQYAKFYSKQTQKRIDQQISLIIKNCTERTRSIIIEKKDLIQKLATKLLEVETIDLSTISQILGERPFKPNKQYQDYLNERKKIVEENVKEKPAAVPYKHIEKLSDQLI